VEKNKRKSERSESQLRIPAFSKRRRKPSPKQSSAARLGPRASPSVNHLSWGGASSKTLLLGAVLALGALLIAAMTVSVKPQLAVGDVIKVCELPFCLQERLPLRFASFGFAACFSPQGSSFT
jgi:hypothetical protein